MFSRRETALGTLLLGVLASFVGDHSVVAQQPSQEHATLAVEELERLRPVVLHDLRQLMQRAYNVDHPTTADVNAEFEDVKFTPLRFGQLGTVVLVEDDGHGSRMAPLLNIYRRSDDRYERIIAEQGFGPALVERNGFPPDLVFGSSSGLAYRTARRYRYLHGRYRLDACDVEEAGRDVHPCPAIAHTFLDPFTAIANGSTDASLSFPPAGLTSREIRARANRQPGS